MKIFFLGTSEFAATILKIVKEKTDWTILSVISERAKPQGRKNQIIDSLVVQYAQSASLDLITPDSLDNLDFSEADAAIVAAYGRIIPKNVFSSPKKGTVNVHPSLLPKLRGPSPIQTTLAQGLTETGVSLMLVDEKVDHGPIVSQESFLIGENENYLTLEYQLAQIGASMIIRDLPMYVSGEIKPQEQNHAEATYTKLIKKEDGLIDWSKSASDIYNQWRAYIKWPGLYTFFKDKSGVATRLKLIEIQKWQTSDVCQKQAGGVFVDESKNLCIACSAGAIKLVRVQPENSKVLTSAEFLNGHKEIVGQILD